MTNTTEPTAAAPKSGWGHPGSGRKFHYFGDDSFSLCRKWGFYFGPLEQGEDEHPDNCKECSRKKLALDKKQTALEAKGL